jgi:8-hydroxy-5-deazaflavin:NADPH oxidoreductase
MKIGILGTGNVGSALGQRWAAKGHRVLYGSRDPQSEKMRELVLTSGANARAATIRGAVEDSDVVVLATPWDVTGQVVQSIAQWNGKIVVDTTNPLNPGLQGLALGYNTSAAEEIARWAPGARVVKAFNTTGANNMTDPHYGGEAASMFVCGDDAAAKAVVLDLAHELGFDAVDVGALDMARQLEPLALLWIKLAYVQGLGRNIAFKLLKR